MTIRFLSILQCLFLGIACTATLVFFQSDNQYPYLQIYLCVLLGLGLITTSIVGIRHGSMRDQRAFDDVESMNSYDLAIAGALIVIAGVLRFNGISQYGLWLDEDKQLALLLRSPDALYIAQDSFQSPLDYFLTLMSLKIFGTSLFALRFFPALLGSIAVGVLYGIGRGFTTRLFSMVIAALMVVQPWLLAYSREGRPYSGAVFLFVLTFQWLVWASRKKESTPIWFGFTIALTALFYQWAILPPITFGVIGIAIFVTPELRESFLRRYAQCSLVALLLWMPMLYMIMTSEVGDYQLFEPNRLWIEAVSFGLKVSSVLGGLVLGFIPLVIAYAFSKKKNVGRVFALVALVYPAFVFLLVKPLFRFPVEERYLLLYVVLFLVALSYAVEALRPKHRAGIYNIGALVYCILIFGLLAQTPSQKLEQVYWREFFEFVEKRESQTGGIAAIVAPVPLDVRMYQGFIGVDIYASRSIRERVTLKSLWDCRLGQSGELVKLLQESPSAPFVYILSNRREYADNLKAMELRPTIAVESLTGGFAFVRISTPERPAETLLGFFEKWKSLEKGSEVEGGIDEFIFGLASLTKRCDLAKKYERVTKMQFRRGFKRRNLEFLNNLYKQSCASSSTN